MNATITAGSFTLGDGQPAFIIAEAGVNHNGDMALARELVQQAKLAGADAVKFQTFKTEKVLIKEAPKAEYQKAGGGGEESYWEMGKKLELSYDQFRALKQLCEDTGILFLSTPFDAESADFLHELAMPLFKISSGELNNEPFVRHVAQFGKPIVLSTGMASLTEVQAAVSLIRSCGTDDVVLLQCTTNYPADPVDANLRAMGTMRQSCDTLIGYSDHVAANEVAFAAVALGACVVEKHFTLDRNMDGPDHQASLDPQGFRALVDGIRTVESALGTGIKAPAASEAETTIVARRSLVARCDIAAGSVIAAEQIDILRPASGIPPTSLSSVLGRRLVRSIAAGQLFCWEDFEGEPHA